MKRLMLLIILVAAPSVQAQPAGVAYRLRGGLFAARPTVCKATAPVDQYYASDLDIMYVCDAANHWKILASASTVGPGTVTTTGSPASGNIAKFSGATSITNATPGTDYVAPGGALGTPSSGTLTNATGLPEGGLSLTDITTNNFSITKHGFVPKGTNVGSFLRDDGTWAAPTGGITNSAGVGVVPQTADGSGNLSPSPITGSVPGSMVNGITVTGGASGTSPKVSSSGSGSSLDFNIQAKGSAGRINIGGNFDGGQITSLRFTGGGGNTTESVLINPSDSGAYISVFGTTGSGSPCYKFTATANAENGLDLSLCRLTGKVLLVGDGSANANGWIQENGVVRQSADFTNATTTLNNTSLSLTLIAGRVYTCHAVLFLSDSTAADGAKFDFGGGTATSTNFIMGSGSALLTSTQTSLTGVFAAATVTGTNAEDLDGTFEVNAGGTFIIRAAQNAHTAGTLTLARGSYLQCRDTP